MPGPLHRVARWLRLALACLTVAGASASAHVLPTAEAVVAVWVERYQPPQQPSTVKAPVSLGRAATGHTRSPSRAAFTGRIREARTPSPPRRLFLVHRALLH